MTDPATSVYWGVPGFIILWLLAIVSFTLFGLRVWRYVRTLRAARPENRIDHPLARAGLFVSQVLGQRRLMEEPVIGLAHLVIFWAFVFYAGSFFWNLIRGLFPILPIPYADETAWMATALVVFGVLGIVALVIAAIRRYIVPPPGLERSGDATLILSLIAIVLLSSLAGIWSKERLPALSQAMWWLHMATVLGFMAYLPYSKHLHLLASPFGVLFGSLQPSSVPPPSEGAARREEFTWRQLFSGLACAECGRCERACPAYQSGQPLSPKMLMHHFKEMVRTTSPTSNGKAFLGDVVAKEEIWACATCLACMARCPVFNEHIPLIVEMRRRLVSEGDFDVRLQTALTNLTRYGNSFGTSPRARSKWTQGLDFKVKDARKEPVEYLWFVGDYASFDPRLQPATQSVARIFASAGIDFGILYESEVNSGNDVSRIGETGLHEMLADKNQQAFEKAQFQRVVTTDPHSLQALKHENGNGHRDLVHYSELLDRLLEEGRLKVLHPLDQTATYHDPCYLGRYNGVYDAPRRVLRRLGIGLQEMPRNRSRSYCCGAGGGRIWMEDAPGTKERASESRVREAAALDGVHTLVTACPKDLVMFHDALKTTGLEEKLVVKDLAAMVEEACCPTKE